MTKKARDTVRKVRALAEKLRICHFATTDGKKPQVRPMAFVLKRNGDIWLSTWVKSRKVQQLRKNPRAEVYLTADTGMHSKIDGVCTISTDPADKKKQWKAQPELVKFFDGPMDPAFIVIKFRPRKYEFMAYGDFAYEVAEVS